VDPGTASLDPFPMKIPFMVAIFKSFSLNVVEQLPVLVHIDQSF
jgi:hypothetical protein